MDEFVSPTSDIFVLYLLGKEENSDLLVNFINAVLVDADFDPIVTALVKNPFNLRNFVNDKESILDVKAVDDSGRIYDIEIQNAGGSNYRNRAIFYWSRNYSAQLKDSENYNKLKPVVSINLLGVDFGLFKDNLKIHRCFLAIDKNDRALILTDHFQLHFIQLKRALEYYNSIGNEVKTDLKDWIDYFLYEGKEIEKMEHALKNNPIIRKAHSNYKVFTASEELREMNNAREKYKRDMATQLEDRWQEGIEQGIEQEKLDFAIKMIAKGMNNNLIHELTDLSFEEIGKLK